VNITINMYVNAFINSLRVEVEGNFDFNFRMAGIASPRGCLKHS
jgi:hypothetical protein